MYTTLRFIGQFCLFLLVFVLWMLVLIFVSENASNAWQNLKLFKQNIDDRVSQFDEQVTTFFNESGSYAACESRFNQDYSVACFGQMRIEDGVTYYPEILATGLNTPWEITWGPDSMLWFTERPGRISRLNIQTKKVELLHTIENCHSKGFLGTFGLAIHPRFDANPFVYVSYNHADIDGSNVMLRLSRFRFDDLKMSLVEELILIDSITASLPAMQGGRLNISPDRKLFLTTADANPSGVSSDTLNTAGKILRLNLDGSVPDDNPFPGSYVYSLGHRNPQGLCFASNGHLYSSEHGNSTNDELNLIQAGKHYGWPLVEGHCDSESEKISCEQMILSSPLKTWTPTIAPSNLVFYDHAAFKKLRNSLLLVSLKEADLRQLKLNAEGDSVIGESILFDEAFGRIRDITLSASGEIYLSTSMHEDFMKSNRRTVAHDMILRLRPSQPTAPN